MSVCAVPYNKTKVSNQTPVKRKLTPPAPKYEFCEGGSNTTNIGGETTVIENTVCCPSPGPAGPPGPAGADGCGLKYVGEWTVSTEYFFESGDPCRTSIVSFEDSLWICTTAHVSTQNDMPLVGDNYTTNWAPFGEYNRMRWMGPWTDGMVYYKNDVVKTLDPPALYIARVMHTSSDQNEPGFSLDWETNWTLKIEGGSGGTVPSEELSFLDKLMNGVFDWISDATLEDWLKALAIGAGIIYAGDKIVDMLTDDGVGDGQADSRFTGSPGYSGGALAPTLPVVVSSLMDYSGFPASAVDVSLLPATPINFTISGSVNIRTVLNQLALAYQFDIVSSGDKVKFVPKYQSVAKVLTQDDLGHVRDELTGGVKYAAKRIQGIDLPRSVTLKYYSSAIDQNIFTQTSTLESYTDGQDAVIEVPFTMTDAQAKAITETVLVNSHIEKQQYTFTTDYHNIELEPADVITLPLDSGTLTTVRIIEINETDDGLLEFVTARSDYNSSSYVSSGAAPAMPPVQPTQTVASVGYSQSLFIEVPSLNGNDWQSPRIKAIVHGYNAPNWPGAAIYRSIDGGSSYSNVTTSSSLATFGMATNIVPPGFNYTTWDTSTSITVQLKQGTLISKSDQAVENGENWCMIGLEVIGFANATLIGPSTYQLTRLLRGRVGSEPHMNTHMANELFVVLDNNLVDIPIAKTDLGKALKYKTVTIGSDVSKVESVDVSPVGLNMRPYAPGNLSVVRQPNNDWIITWVERPRAVNTMPDYSTMTHLPEWGGFGVVITLGSDVKRSATTTAPTYTYTSAMQVTDFGSVQSTLNVSVSEINMVVGGGYPSKNF